MKNHIIFDMDGVIIDSEPEYQKRIKIFMKRNEQSLLGPLLEIQNTLLCTRLDCISAECFR